MEQNLPVIAKRIWSIVRVVYYMLRKGISKRKLLVDLNMMLKRGKIAGKAISNLMTFHHQHRHDDRHISSFVAAPREYEFSCSNTPSYTFPSFKRRHSHHHHHNLFACAHAPPTQDDDLATMNAVKVVLEMLNNNNNNNNNNNEVILEAYSPVLPGFGFGRSPAVRQLRITDSPFPLRDVDDSDNGFVDKAAEEFIDKFYKELKKQKRVHGF